MNPTHEVEVRCPCCGGETITVILSYDDTPGHSPSLEMDDFDPQCECHDYLGRLPKLTRAGVAWDAATDKYRSDLLERALDTL